MSSSSSSPTCYTMDDPSGDDSNELFDLNLPLTEKVIDFDVYTNPTAFVVKFRNAVSFIKPDGDIINVNIQRTFWASRIMS